MKQWKRFFTGLAGAAMSLLAQTQVDQLLRLQGLGNSSIAEFRRQVRPLLTSAQRDIEAQIEYSILATGAANAQATMDAAGRRRIVIGAGMLQVFEFMSVGMFMNPLGARQCGVDYMNHIFEGVIKNGYALDTGTALTPVYEPFAYAQRNRSNCRGVTFERFRDNDAFRRGQPAVLGGSLRWLLAHELGHHLYGHVKKRPTTPSESRANEMEADQFAFRVSVMDGPEGIAFAMPAYLFLGGVGGGGEGESTSTHPAGSRRAEIFFDALKGLPDKAPEFRQYLSQNGLTEKWNQIVDQLLGVLRSDFARP